MYLASLQQSGVDRREPPACAHNKDVFDLLMEYFHKDRPDIIPPTTCCSMAGLASTIAIDECVDDGDSLAPHTPSTSSPATSEPGSRSGRRVTAVTVLQSLVERQEGRMEATKHQQAVDNERTALLAKALIQQQKTSSEPSSERVPGPDVWVNVAMTYLAELLTHEDIEDDEDAMSVVQCVADVVHGSDTGPAQRMAACVWALSKRGLPVARAVGRLRALAPRTAMRSGSGSGAGDGGFIHTP